MKCVILILLQCTAFHLVDMRLHSVSSSSELAAVLSTASPGDEIILEPTNYQGDFTVSIDSITVSGKSGNNKDAKISGTIPITVSANHVTIQSLVLNGDVKAAGQEITLKALSINGNIHFNSPRGSIISNSVTSVTIDSDDGKIQSNSIKELTINGCHNILRANSYGKIQQAASCTNDIDHTNAHNQSGSFTGSSFYLTVFVVLCVAATQRLF